MPESCPRLNDQPCPVDRKFEAIKATYTNYPGLLEMLSRIREAVEVKRAEAPCEGLVIENNELQHCGSHAAKAMQETATNMGGMLGFETAEFKDLTRSVIR